MSETLTKLDNLSKTVRASARIFFQVHALQACSVGIENKKYCENKNSPVLKHVEIWQFVFAKVV